MRSRSPIDVESEPGKLVVESQVDMKYFLPRETRGEKSENKIGRKRRPLFFSFPPLLAPSGNIKIPFTQATPFHFSFFFIKKKKKERERERDLSQGKAAQSQIIYEDAAIRSFGLELYSTVPHRIRSEG